MSDERLVKALAELEALKIEQARGKHGWAVWHGMSEKRLGLVEMSVSFLTEISDEVWNAAFKNVRVLQAIPDVFKGTIEYWCTGPMFDVVRQPGLEIPRYTINVTQVDGEVDIAYEKCEG